MDKTDLQKKTGTSWSVIAKMAKNEKVSIDASLKICSALHCDISDILEVVEVEKVENCGEDNA